jgi:hypothetical protein
MRSPLGGRAFPLGALLFLLLILVHLPYAWPGGPFLHHPRPLTLLVDEGTLLYDGYRTALGEVMYRDFFEFQGPVQYYLLGLLFSWSGPSIGAARVLQIAVWALSALLLALVARRFCGVAASAAVALIHASIYVLALPVTYAHWLAELFVLLAILLLTRRQATPASDVGAGLALGLAVMTIQSMGIPALVAAAGTAALPGLAARSPRAAALRPARILAAAAAVVLAILGCFAAHGAAGDLWYAMFEWPFGNYLPGQNIAFGFGRDWMIENHARVPSPWLELTRLVTGFIVGLPYLLGAAAAVCGALALVRLRRRQTDFRFVVAVGIALACVSPLALKATRTDITHVAFAGGVTLAGVVAMLEPLRGRSRFTHGVATVLLCGAAGLGLVHYAYKLVTTWEASRAKSAWSDEVYRLGYSRAIATATAAGDRIVCGVMAGYYYLYVRPSATSYTLIYDYYTEAQWQQMADQIVENRPRVLVLRRWQLERLEQLRPLIAQRYRRVKGDFYLLRDERPPAVARRHYSA